MSKYENAITANELLQRQIDALFMRVSNLEQQLTRMRGVMLTENRFKGETRG